MGLRRSGERATEERGLVTRAAPAEQSARAVETQTRDARAALPERALAARHDQESRGPRRRKRDRVDLRDPNLRSTLTHTTSNTHDLSRLSFNAPLLLLLLKARRILFSNVIFPFKSHDADERERERESPRPGRAARGAARTLCAFSLQ